MDEPAVLCSAEAGVATLTLRNPAKRNAVSAEMWAQLPPLLSQLAADPAVHAVVITGYGGTFCAGADIGMLGDTARTWELASAAEEALAAFPKPTLARIRGHCVGGGCQLAAACDLRFAERDALFGVTPARLGLVYAAPSTARLVELIGPAAAKYLLYSAELIGTERALRCGLVDEVLPDAAALETRVGAFTALLGERSQLTQRAAKEYVSAPPTPDRAAHWERAMVEESTEGVAAFLERRPPRFEWRG